MPETIAELPTTDPEDDTTTEVTPEVQEAIDGWWDAVVNLEKYTKQKEACSYAIGRMLTPGQAVGGLTLTKPGQRFDPRKARKVLTAKELAAISLLEPNADLARAQLPERYAELTVTTAPYVRRVRQ